MIMTNQVEHIIDEKLTGNCAPFSSKTALNLSNVSFFSASEMINSAKDQYDIRKWSAENTNLTAIQFK